MIKVDLITGFLGSGKTTFLKMYGKYFMDQGQKIGILENDYGAVNVDMMLLQDMRGENCELEMVAGGCDADCHRRRFKTKLIAMAMSGYNRVIIEPSGIFDMDEFFDTLREEPLENWYEIGNVIAIVDSKNVGNNQPKEIKDNKFDAEEFIFSSQLSNAGVVVLSKTGLANSSEIASAKEHIKAVSENIGCRRPLEKLIIDKNWEDFSGEDFEKIINSGYQMNDYVKRFSINEAGFTTLYFLEHGLDEGGIKSRVKTLFEDEKYGQILRIKGFYKKSKKNMPEADENAEKKEDESSAENNAAKTAEKADYNFWYELNATKGEFNVSKIKLGQEVIIVIGFNVDKEKVQKLMDEV